MSESWQTAADIATVVSAFATVVSAFAAVAAAIGAILLLGATVRQLKATARQQTANFWLQLRQMFKAHDDTVHRKLIPGGAWWDTGEAPGQWTAAGPEGHEDQDGVDEEEEAE
jgi:hypothetical protein